MKTYLHACRVGIALAVCIAAASALAVEPGAPRGSLLVSEDISRFAVSGNYEYQDRDVGAPFGWVLESQSLYALVSFDPFVKWLTLSAGGGSTEVKPSVHESYGDWGAMWTAGFKLNVWEYNVKDPTYLISRARIQASAAYAAYNAEIKADDIKWDEWRGSVTFCAEFFNDSPPAGDPERYPFSTTLFLGPVFSAVDRDDPGYRFPDPMEAYRFDKQEDWGLLVGAEVYLAHNFCIGWEARTYDGFEYTTHNLHAALHF